MLDYCGGIEDLRAGVIRTIGEPVRRFTEDPVRMIRAVRHAARTGFTIEPETYQAIQHCAHLIDGCSKARVHEEFVRELVGGVSCQSLELMDQSGLMTFLMPELAKHFSQEGEGAKKRLFETAKRIDAEIKEHGALPTSVIFLAVHLDLFPDEIVGDHDSIRDVIADIFKSPGATRREREQMEHTLLTAFQLFHETGNTGKARRIVGRQSFYDALQLIRLTAANSEGRRCVDFWEKQGAAARHAPETGDGMMRRRRRYRRR